MEDNDTFKYAALSSDFAETWVIHYDKVPASFTYYTLKRESSMRKYKRTQKKNTAWFSQWCKTHRLPTDYK